MSCKYFCIRTEKGCKYCYCRLIKQRITWDSCKCCNKKEYKERKQIKGKKHTQTKHTEIKMRVKEKVWDRDNYSCIFCGKRVPLFYANAHLIPRSAGGLGIEENIFTACDDCHREQDNGLNAEKYTKEAETYLRSRYKDWSEDKLIYKKY